jgi:hypothetical protein
MPPLPTPLEEFRDRKRNALQAITEDVLGRVWDGFHCGMNVCRVTQDAQNEG